MILFVFEGERREPQLYQALESLFFNEKEDKTIVCSFGCNIYELYRRVNLLGEGADIVSILRKDLEGRDDNPLRDITTSSEFAEIYLFFDYDLHHNNKRHSLSLEEINSQLHEMLVTFNDETENGKLYINYPMVESIRHVKELPDSNYHRYTVPRDNCKDFKLIVQEFSGYGNLRFLTDTNKDHFETTKQNWQHLIDMNVSKANYICHGVNEYPENKSDITQKNIFDSQLQKYVNTDECSVAILNAFPIFLYDYFK